MKHIISIILFLFLGFSPKCTAQTDHAVTLLNSTCLEKKFKIQYAVTTDSIVPTTFQSKKLPTIMVPEGSFVHLKFELTAEALAEYPLNGVTVFDMVLFTKHLIRSQEITSPEILFAADINNNGEVTIADFIEFREVIYAIQTGGFKNNKSRRPFSWDKKKGSQNDIFTFLIDKDTVLKFGAVKIGDLNGNSSCN
jgi:hypothetical protein